MKPGEPRGGETEDAEAAFIRTCVVWYLIKFIRVLFMCSAARLSA